MGQFRGLLFQGKLKSCQEYWVLSLILISDQSNSSGLYHNPAGLFNKTLLNLTNERKHQKPIFNKKLFVVHFQYEG